MKVPPWWCSRLTIQISYDSCINTNLKLMKLRTAILFHALVRKRFLRKDMRSGRDFPQENWKPCGPCWNRLFPGSKHSHFQNEPTCKTFLVKTNFNENKKSLLGLVFQGATKVSFTACHSRKLWLAFTYPKFISTSPKNVLISRIDYTVLL